MSGGAALEQAPARGAPAVTTGAALHGPARWCRSALEPRLQILRLLPCAGPALIVALVVVNVALGLLPAAFILATSVLMERVPAAVSGGPGSPAFDALMSTFLLAAAAFIGPQVLAPIQGALAERMRRRVDGQLRDETLRVVMQSAGIAPMEEQETLNALSEVTRLLDAGSNTPGMACSGLLALIARYLRLSAVVAVVAVVASWPAATALAGAALLFRHGNRGGLRKYSAVWRDVAAINRRAIYLRDLAMGGAAAKELRILGLIPWLTRCYRRAFFAAYDPVAARRRQIYLKPYLVYTPIGVAVGAWVMSLLARDAATGQLSLGELAVGIQAATMALLLGEFYPESDVPTQFGMQAVAALAEVRQRVGRFPTVDRGDDRRVPEGTPAGSLRLDDVSFQYPGTPHRVLNGLTLDLPVGKCTAIVGVNGAGKTTLVKLLTRLYEPTGGAIRADDVDIAAFDAAAWRRQVSVIFQDFVRYELSAADNIALGAAHVQPDPAALARAAREAGIFEVLSRMPSGFNTPLSRAYRGGVDLSGGEWQRIAIARALYALRAGARVLILDEPTSALDVRAEAAFFDRFVELTRGVTSLLISHRFSSVRRADRIVVIDGGRALEQGSHSDLMAADGHYARLFRLQAERFAAGMDDDGGPVSAVQRAPASAARAPAS
jgi:ATP-binding cassette, subfamily B, bacterial